MFEQAEQAYESKILQLEQENIAIKQHARSHSQDQKKMEMKETLNNKVLEEMENLESRYIQGEEELRSTNTLLRKKLLDTQKSERDSQNKLQSLQSKINVTETEEYACIKRIES